MCLFDSTDYKLVRKKHYIISPSLALLHVVRHGQLYQFHLQHIPNTVTGSTSIMTAWTDHECHILTWVVLVRLIVTVMICV